MQATLEMHLEADALVAKLPRPDFSPAPDGGVGEWRYRWGCVSFTLAGGNCWNSAVANDVEAAGWLWIPSAFVSLAQRQVSPVSMIRYARALTLAEHAAIVDHLRGKRSHIIKGRYHYVLQNTVSKVEQLALRALGWTMGHDGKMIVQIAGKVSEA